MEQVKNSQMEKLTSCLKELKNVNFQREEKVKDGEDR